MRKNALALGLILALALLVLPASAPARAAEGHGDGHPYRIRLHVERELPRLLATLKAREFDVTYADEKRQVIELMGGAGELAALRELGLAPEVVDGPASPEALSDYLSPAEIETLLAQFEAAHPALARRVPYATDHEGRTAYALKISDNVALEEDEPAILYVAQHHAREVMTPEVAIDTIRQLLEGYATNATYRRYVDDYEIWVIATHNPDGANQVFTGNTNWRKNRRVNGDGTFGVDLNRNYPFAWNRCAGSSGSPGSDTYRGPSPGSEPTTIGLMNLAREHRPVYFVTYHTYGEYALHTYGCEGVFAGQPDGQTLRELANEVSARIPGDQPNSWYRFGTPWELLYAVDGDSDGWLYGELGAMGVTFELNMSSLGFQPDYATWRDTTVERARGGWLYFLERMAGPRISGHVRDACTGAALGGASIALAEQQFGNGETPRTTTPLHGRIDWPVLPGTYTLQVDEDGYAAQNWTVEVGHAPAVREVALVPDGSGGAALASFRVVDAEGDGDGLADPGETVDVYLTAYATGAPLAALSATLGEADPYVTIVDGEASFGALAAGARVEGADPVRVAIAADAPDGHVAALSVAFAAAAPFCAPAADLALPLTRGVPSCPAIEERLDIDPNWAIDNGGSALGWAFGHPTGPGPDGGFTGLNVYGTNLSGNYGDGERYTLTAGPYDLADLRNTELRFARWLEAEPGYDIARVEIRTGSGPDWRVVWEGFGRDTAWVPLRRDVAALVDGESEVYVRFSLTTDNGSTDAGFYVDDLAFCGEQLPAGGPRVRYAAHAVDDGDAAYANANGQVDPGETFTLVVDLRNAGGAAAEDVTAVLDSVSPGVTIHNRVAAFGDIGPSGLARSLAPHFTVTTSGACGSTLTFTLTSRWQDGGRATSTFNVPVGALRETTRLVADMETDTGWTAGGNATGGQFVRQDPHLVTDPEAGLVQPGDDVTPAPGALCWVTGNPPVGGGFNPRSGDVDRGTAYVQSPVFDGSGSGSLVARFSRFYHQSGLLPTDEASYAAQVSRDGGASWVDLERLQAGAAAWVAREFDLAAFIEPSASMRLRFSASEQSRTPADPLTELLVDEVSVVRQTIVCDAYTAPETKAPNPVGPTLLVAREREDVRLSWTAPPADAQHDPARFYPVVRSTAPAGGFAPAGDPSAPVWRDAGAAPAGQGSFFYLVGARNAAGESGELP